METDAIHRGKALSLSTSSTLVLTSAIFKGAIIFARSSEESPILIGEIKFKMCVKTEDKSKKTNNKRESEYVHVRQLTII